MVKGYLDFDNLQIEDETVLLIPDLAIYPQRRKVFCIQEEISLTVKEYDILCLLVINQGRVLTYDWIYEKIWGEVAVGNINNAIACHIHNLREKIYKVLPKPQFSIRCVREIGYCLELKIEPKKIT
ncbi:MAG: winged helix-turn-helix domain-containing protein [Acetatifactor muris]|nr:winged helix-turn-helix domain-containing protein [Acetatifactor muris]